MTKIVVPQHKLEPLIQASTVVPKDMTWLWYPYIPAQAATMIYGPGGIGKSHITCAIATAVSRGDPFPGEETRRKPGKVLMLSAEDDLEVVLVPRLIKMGANLDNIFISPKTFILDKQGLKDVEDYVRQSTAVVCFIDPIVAWVGGKIDINRSNDVRTMIGPLHTMAQQTGCATIIVHHSRKGSEGEDYEKAMGSSDFTNAVRSTMYVTRTNDGTKLIKHAKHNYSEAGATLSFSFDSGTFEWGTTWEDDLPTTKTKSVKPRAAAVAFLKVILATGPVPAKEIEQAAKDEGINMGTLNRAKTGIAESFLEHTDDGKLMWFWKLIGDEHGKAKNDSSDQRPGASGVGHASGTLSNTPEIPQENRASSGQSNARRPSAGVLTNDQESSDDRPDAISTDIPDLEGRSGSQGQVEIPAGRGSPRNAVEPEPHPGDHRPDGDVGQDRGTASEEDESLAARLRSMTADNRARAKAILTAMGLEN